MSFYCLFGEGKPHLLGGPGPAVRVFQKILGLTANVMDRFGHLTVCVRAPPGCVRVCACVRALLACAPSGYVWVLAPWLPHMATAIPTWCSLCWTWPRVFHSVV